MLTRVFTLLNRIVFNNSNGLIIMFNSMSDELKEVKYFKKVTDVRSLIMQNTLKSLMSWRVVFRTQASIYHGAFLWLYLKAYYFCNKSSITDVRLDFMQASGNIEIFKVKLRPSESSPFLQRVAFLIYFQFPITMPKF